MRRPSMFARREQLEVAMTPMIDVVFLLLVFFIWTASFAIPEESLSGSISAPAVGGGEPIDEPVSPVDDFDQVVLRVVQGSDGARWLLNDQVIVDEVTLKTRLAAIAAVRREAPLILHPDSDVVLGDVIQAYDIARTVGFEAIQFATPAEESR